MIPVGWAPPHKRPNPHVFDEFPFGPGLSILELKDPNAECRKHGRCAFDPSPPCGCFAHLEGAEVIRLPEKKPTKKRRAA